MSVKYFNKDKQMWEKIASIVATSIHVVDADGNFESSNIEGCLSELSDTLNQKIDNIVYTDEGFLKFYANEILIKSIKIESNSSVDSASIDELKNEKIDDVQIDTRDGITYINLFANDSLLKSIEIKTGGDGLISVGAEEPTAENCEVWIDVNDDEEYMGDITDLMVIEIKSVIEDLQNEIKSLKNVILSQEARITYLELNSGNGCDCSGGHGGTQYKPLISEDGDKLILEDGTILTFEDLINNI